MDGADWLNAAVKFLWLLLCALLVNGCATHRQYESADAIAERKQVARTQREKENERNNQTLRLTVRQLYLQDHPKLSAATRKAILKERISIGMTTWDVIAAYSLWEYTSDARLAKYRDIGAPALWFLINRSQTMTGNTQHEQWVLARQKDTQHLLFENGILTTSGK